MVRRGTCGRTSLFFLVGVAVIVVLSVGCPGRGTRPKESPPIDKRPLPLPGPKVLLVAPEKGQVPRGERIHFVAQLADSSLEPAGEPKVSATSGGILDVRVSDDNRSVTFAFTSVDEKGTTAAGEATITASFPVKQGGQTAQVTGSAKVQVDLAGNCKLLPPG